MGTKYSSVTISGYNSSPPADDGSTAASNQVTWSKHKTKIGDPLKTAVEAINTALVTALDTSSRSVTANDSTLAGDNGKTIVIASTVTSTITVSLMDAATAAAGYIVTVSNESQTVTHTVGRVTATNTISNSTADYSLPPLSAVTFVVSPSGSGYSLKTPAQPSVPRSYLAGLTLSTAGSSATMSIAAGSCADSTNAQIMALSAIAKTTSAWAVGTGNGGLDTGAIANSTWYHFYVIKRVDTNVVDVVFSTSASAPTLPANYTLYRRIGSGLTNGSAQWVKFVQDGDTFLWDTMALDINTTTASSSAANYALSTPLGIKTTALLHGTFTLVGGAGGGCLLSSPDEADIAPAVATGKVTYTNCVDSQYVAGDAQVRTNASSQIRVRCTNNNSNLNINTYGWIDTRGRDA